jgi:hypothetical protein
MKTEFVFKRNTSANHTIQGGQSLILFQIGLFSSHVSLQRHPSVLQTGDSRALCFFELS